MRGCTLSLQGSPPHEAGVNLNARDYDGCAPADDAIGDEEALKLILEVRRRGGFFTCF